MGAKTAVQLFTVSEFCNTPKDFATSIKKCSDIGFKAAQVSGVACLNGLKPDLSAPEAKKILDDNDMQCIITHRPWASLVDNLSYEIDFHKALDCDYIAIGGVDQNMYEHTAQGYRQWLNDARPIIAKLKENGIKFGHHNHAHEFQRTEFHGITLEDILIEEGGEDLLLEFDLYWIAHAGASVTEYLNKGKGRVPVVHLKDKEIIELSNDTHMAPIGEGVMPWSEIIPACEAAGVQWYAIEQDVCRRDPFDCLQSSWDFLTSLGV